MIWYFVICGLLTLAILLYCMAVAFKEDEEQHLVTCPACHGVCGINVAINMNESGDSQADTWVSDWYDCDFCDATGKVSQIKASEYKHGMDV